jgi:hypothetical protein
LRTNEKLIWKEDKRRLVEYVLSGLDQKTTVSNPWQLAASSSRKNR